MEGNVRQLYEFDGSNLFPITRPDAFVSSVEGKSTVGINTIGELIDSSSVQEEPEFVFRVQDTGDMKATRISEIPGIDLGGARLKEPIEVTNIVGDASGYYPAGYSLEDIVRQMLSGASAVYDVNAWDPSIFTFSLGPDIDMRPNHYHAGDSITLNCVYDVSDGYFTPRSGYSESRFIELNGSNPLNAGCTFGDPAYSFDSSVISPTQRIALVQGENVFILTLEHGQSTVIPLKSDATDSSVIVPSGTLTRTVTLTVSGPYDVDKVNPVAAFVEPVVTRYDGSDGSIFVGMPVNITFAKGTFTDGRFEPKPGYDVERFSLLNGECPLPAGCEGSWYAAYGSQPLSFMDSSTYTVNVVVPNESLTLKMRCEYSDSTAVPKRSDNSDSSVRILAGIQTKTWTKKYPTDKDPDAVPPRILPYPAEHYVTFGDGTEIKWESPYEGIIMNKTAGDIVRDCSFYYYYQDGSFIMPNVYDIPADCYKDPSDCSLRINGNTESVAFKPQYSYIHLSSLPLLSENTFYYYIRYDESATVPPKLSGTPSEVSIPAGRASVTVTLRVNGLPGGKRFYIATTKLSEVPFDRTVEEFIRIAPPVFNYMISEEELTQTRLEIFTNNCSAGDRIFFIAPSEYVNVQMLVGGFDQSESWILHTGIPLNADPAADTYTIFERNGKMQSNPYRISSAVLTKNRSV